MQMAPKTEAKLLKCSRTRHSCLVETLNVKTPISTFPLQCSPISTSTHETKLGFVRPARCLACGAMSRWRWGVAMVVSR